MSDEASLEPNQQSTVPVSSRRHLPASAMLSALVLFSLPWINLSCGQHTPGKGTEIKFTATQSGFQAIYGDANFYQGTMTQAQTRDKAGGQRDSKGAPLMGLNVTLLAVGIVSSFTINGRVSRLKTLAVCSAGALALLLVQMAIGFPLGGNVGVGSHSSPMYPNEFLDVYYTVWFWLALAATAAAPRFTWTEWARASRDGWRAEAIRHQFPSKHVVPTLVYVTLAVLLTLAWCGRHQLTIHEAAAKGNVAVVRARLKEGIAPDALDTHNSEGKAALHCTTDVEVAAVLMDAGADVNLMGGNFGERPLHLAKTAAMATLLIENGADVEAMDRLGYTPLFAHLSDVEILKVLLKHKAKVNVLVSGESALRRLIHIGESDVKLEVMTLLLDAGAEINDEHSPLGAAMAAHRWDLVRLLLARGARVDESHKEYARSFALNYPTPVPADVKALLLNAKP